MQTSWQCGGCYSLTCTTKHQIFHRWRLTWEPQLQRIWIFRFFLLELLAWFAVNRSLKTAAGTSLLWLWIRNQHVGVSDNSTQYLDCGSLDSVCSLSLLVDNQVWASPSSLSPGNLSLCTCFYWNTLKKLSLTHIGIAEGLALSFNM